MTSSNPFNPPVYLTDETEQKMRKMLAAGWPRTVSSAAVKAEVIDLAVQAVKRAEIAFFDTLALASDLEVGAMVLPLGLSVARGVFEALLEGAIEHTKAQGHGVAVRHGTLE